jgi:hypothetical protein
MYILTFWIWFLYTMSLSTYVAIFGFTKKRYFTWNKFWWFILGWLDGVGFALVRWHVFM